MVEIAGPERAGLDELVGRFLSATKDPREVVTDVDALLRPASKRSIAHPRRPMRLGALCPIWFIVWWVIWQCSAQSPGLSAINSTVRVCPTATRTAASRPFQQFSNKTHEDGSGGAPSGLNYRTEFLLDPRILPPTAFHSLAAS
jgi:hypothetical protein